MKVAVTIIVALAALVTGACTGSEPADVSTSSQSPVETLIPEDDAIYSEIFQDAINQTGLALPVERWVELAEAGCREGVWQRPVATTLASAFIDSLDSGDRAQLLAVYRDDLAAARDDTARLVWIISLAGCRDEFPQAEIERGPPVGAGQ